MSVLYVTLWMVRCVLLTLTVASFALRFQLGSDLVVVTRSARQLFRGSDGHVTAIETAESEVERRGKRWKGMQEACESYVEEMTDIVLKKVSNLS